MGWFVFSLNEAIYAALLGVGIFIMTGMQAGMRWTGNDVEEVIKFKFLTVDWGAIAVVLLAFFVFALLFNFVPKVAKVLYVILVFCISIFLILFTMMTVSTIKDEGFTLAWTLWLGTLIILLLASLATGIIEIRTQRNHSTVGE